MATGRAGLRFDAGPGEPASAAWRYDWVLDVDVRRLLYFRQHRLGTALKASLNIRILLGGRLYKTSEALSEGSCTMEDGGRS